jgi:hypothetical protein
LCVEASQKSVSKRRKKQIEQNRGDDVGAFS